MLCANSAVEIVLCSNSVLWRLCYVQIVCGDGVLCANSVLWRLRYMNLS